MSAYAAQDTERGYRIDALIVSQPHKVRAEEHTAEAQPNGGGTHTASALRSKTAPSLFVRTWEIPTPCIQFQPGYAVAGAALW
jgi:hypothetical protein